MTQSRACTLTDLAECLLKGARSTPVRVQRIEVALPMEFGLRHMADSPQIAMTPPDDPQARGLAVPLGRFDFTLEITERGSNG